MDGYLYPEVFGLLQKVPRYLRVQRGVEANGVPQEVQHVLEQLPVPVDEERPVLLVGLEGESPAEHGAYHPSDSSRPLVTGVSCTL